MNGVVKLSSRRRATSFFDPGVGKSEKSDARSTLLLLLSDTIESASLLLVTPFMPSFELLSMSFDFFESSSSSSGCGVKKFGVHDGARCGCDRRNHATHNNPTEGKKKEVKTKITKILKNIYIKK